MRILAGMSGLTHRPDPPADIPAPRGKFSPVLGILFLLIAALLVWAAMSADSLVSRRVLADATPSIKRAAHFLSKSGDGQWPILAGLLVMAAGWKMGRRNWRQAGLAIALATVLAGLAAISVRAVCGRARPSNRIEQGWFGPYHDGKWSAFRHPYSSFPSGHTATAAAFGMAVTCVARRWGWVSLLWMAGVGWARICLEPHHFSDVLAGAFFGLATALLVLRWFHWPRLDGAPPGRVAGSISEAGVET